MNRKQLFTLLGVLSALCLCVAGLSIAGVGYLGKNFNKAIDNADDPASIQKIASSVVDYTLPEGYTQKAFDMLIYKYVMLSPKQGTFGPFIMMMSYPSNSRMNEEQIQEQLQRTFLPQTGQNASMKVVGTKTVSIRGNDEKVTIMEGKTGNGYLLRQWLIVFKGKSGPVMLMIQGFPGEWDEKMIDGFVASIK